MYDRIGVNRKCTAKVEWKVDRTSPGAMRCLSSILASRTSRSMNHAIFHHRCIIRATSFFHTVSPEKINLRRLPLHAYHYACLYNSDPLTVLREIRQFKGIDINFNGSVFYARRDSRVISTRAVCMCVCMYGFRKNRVLNLRRKP